MKVYSHITGIPEGKQDRRIPPAYWRLQGHAIRHTKVPVIFCLYHQ
jgi:hypothetical protein